MPADAGAPRKPGAAVPAEPGVKYSAVCASCGKTTELNFKPMEGRPIYCRDCLAKIKAGEMPRVRMERPKSARPQERFMSDLAGMGIEFEAPREERKEPPRQRESVFREMKETREENPAPAAPQTPSKFISLKDLKPEPPREKFQKPKKNPVDIDELRDAVKSALKSALSEEPISDNNNDQEEKAL